MEWMDLKSMTGSRSVRSRIVVISMAQAADRRLRFRARARNATVPWSFQAAHTRLLPALSYDERDAVVAKGRPLRPGELGCYSSHYAVWQALQADDADQYVVLEDDVIVDWTFIAKLVQLDLGAMGIRYLRLYYKFPARAALVHGNFIERGRSVVELCGCAYGTQGYVVTRQGAARLLEHCRTVRRPIDDELDRTWAHGLPNLAVFPFPIMEESACSTIGAARFETYAVPAELRLKRLLAHRIERWRRDASAVIRRFRRLQARCGAIPRSED